MARYVLENSFIASASDEFTYIISMSFFRAAFDSNNENFFACSFELPTIILDG